MYQGMLEILALCTKEVSEHVPETSFLAASSTKSCLPMLLCQLIQYQKEKRLTVNKQSLTNSIKHH